MNRRPSGILMAIAAVAAGMGFGSFRPTVEEQQRARIIVNYTGHGHGGKRRIWIPLAHRRARRRFERSNRHAAQRRLRQAA